MRRPSGDCEAILITHSMTIAKEQVRRNGCLCRSGEINETIVTV